MSRWVRPGRSCSNSVTAVLGEFPLRAQLGAGGLDQDRGRGGRAGGGHACVHGHRRNGDAPVAHVVDLLPPGPGEEHEQSDRDPVLRPGVATHPTTGEEVSCCDDRPGAREELREDSQVVGRTAEHEAQATDDEGGDEEQGDQLPCPVPPAPQDPPTQEHCSVDRESAEDAVMGEQKEVGHGRLSGSEGRNGQKHQERSKIPEKHGFVKHFRGFLLTKPCLFDTFCGS